MNEWRRSLFVNPTAWYTGMAACLLAFSLWIPWLTGSRTARVEKRADDIASVLLSATEGFDSSLAEADLESVLSRFYRNAVSLGVRVKDIERLQPPPTGSMLCLHNKHYAFQLSEAPPPPASRPGQNTHGALEVIAWPLSVVGPGHCTFFYPQDASRAYSRNLHRGYAGMEEAGRPMPGSAHRRPGAVSRWAFQYSGNDNERWILY